MHIKPGPVICDEAGIGIEMKFSGMWILGITKGETSFGEYYCFKYFLILIWDGLEFYWVVEKDAILSKFMCAFTM